MNDDPYFLQRLKEREWRAYRRRKRARLKNPGFSILATNCIGGVMYHDLGLEFLTPTVNLTISIRDLIKLAENPQWYMAQPLVELPNPGGCPTALLEDIQVNFIHYNSFEEASEKWEERKRKINWDRLVLVTTDRDGCDYETIRRFDQLPYPHKVIFTHKPYPEFPSACYMSGFEDQEQVGVLTNFRPGFWKRRYMDSFDYVKFLNGVE